MEIPQEINVEMWEVRVKAFGLELLSIGIASAIGFFSSDAFAQLVTTHFGEGVVSGLFLLLVNAVVKHVRNVRAVKAAVGKLGGTLTPVGIRERVHLV